MSLGANVFVKDPQAILDYTIDWLACGYLDGSTSPIESLNSSAWRIDPDEGSPAEMTIVYSTNDDTSTTVKVSGGVVGKRYGLINTVMTSGGRTDERTIVVRVENQ